MRRPRIYPLPGGEAVLRQTIQACIDNGTKPALRQGLEIHDAYIRSCRQITDPATYSVLATLWRMLMIEQRLVDALCGAERLRAKPDQRANIIRELVRFYARKGRRKLAYNFMAEAISLRTDPAEQAMDRAAEAVRLMHSGHYPLALNEIFEAVNSLGDTPAISDKDVREISLLMLLAAGFAGNETITTLAIQQLTGGGYVQGKSVPPELRRSRRRFIKAYQLVASSPALRKAVLRIALLTYS